MSFNAVFEISLQLYEKAIELIPNIERKGQTMPYTSLNGHMFSFIDKEGNIGLRLMKDEREEFIIKYNTKIMEQYGRQMKEYVVVPDDLLNKTETFSDYLQKSYDYISTLKPKPTKKKSK